jgi:hypothetical protein
MICFVPLLISTSMNYLDVLSSCGSWLRLCRSSSLRAWSRTQGWVYIARPHTGVPEIGRSIQTHPCRTTGIALPVASSKQLCSIRVTRHHSRWRDHVCKSINLWHSMQPHSYSTKGSALPVASAKTSCSIRVTRHHHRRRDRVCKSTDFWYSSMRAVCIHDLARSDARARIAQSSEFLAYSDTCAQTAKHRAVLSHNDTSTHKTS